MNTVYIIAIGVAGGVLLVLLVLYRNKLTYLMLRVGRSVAVLRATPQPQGHQRGATEPSREPTTKIVKSRLHRFNLTAVRDPSLDIEKSQITKSTFNIGRNAGRQDGDDG